MTVPRSPQSDRGPRAEGSPPARRQRKRFTGRVAAAGRMARTITVDVARFPWHAKLSKQFRRSSRLLVDDPLGQARVGDQVVIEETRPLSKRKHFRMIEILHAAGVSAEELAGRAVAGLERSKSSNVSAEEVVTAAVPTPEEL